MEKQEIISKISEKIGIDSGVVEKVVDAISEKGSLMDELKEFKHHPEELVKEISSKADVGVDDCEKIFNSLKEELHPGFLEKLMFWKHPKE